MGKLAKRAPERRTTVTVDPGITGTGYATWGKGHLPYNAFAVVKPVALGWEQRSYEYVKDFRVLLGDATLALVVIEDQSIWLDSAKAHASATRGDIIKLAHLTGMFMLAAKDAGVKVRLLPVATWKGQLTKQAVDFRIWRKIGQRYPNHASDAVGMGLFIRGEF